ncbi:MAG: hypothetical protein QNK29_10130, partial [Desulfobacterales bacterium]|nr:hypothetical protein [Desulfobacterales bacterium]MDX2512276.1 hypothetical protein [Desulfobacterales bacterium]
PAMGIKSALVQIEAGADLYDLGLIKHTVVGKKRIMKVPEPTLGVSRQGSGGSLTGKFVTAQGEILEYECDLLGIFLEQLLEYRRKPGAVRSLKISINRHHHRCVYRSHGGRSVNGNLLDEIQVEFLNSVAGGVNQKKLIFSRPRFNVVYAGVHHKCVPQFAVFLEDLQLGIGCKYVNVPSVAGDSHIKWGCAELESLHYPGVHLGMGHRRHCQQNN